MQKNLGFIYLVLRLFIYAHSNNIKTILTKRLFNLIIKLKKLNAKCGGKTPK